jgi:hypothetical protein
MTARWFCVTIFAATAYGQQVADPNFDARVVEPAFTTAHPRVGIDESHKNFHTKDGRYKPFAALIASDGFTVGAAPKFTLDALKRIDILVIANALGNEDWDKPEPAFSAAECDAVRDWVGAGGALLLIADHAPFGDSAAALAKRFDVDMGRGFVADRKNSIQNPTLLVFSGENGLLGDHAIIRGRNGRERVRTIFAFTGQSLSVPKDGTALMKMGKDAVEMATREELRDFASGKQVGKSVVGRAQGIAMPFGKGRIAIFGEAAMFSAQRAGSGAQAFKMGMNAEGNDDRQFALNVMHWLARALD